MSEDLAEAAVDQLPGESLTSTTQPSTLIPQRTSSRRRADSLSETGKGETVLYLAYGSNLCDQTFLKMRKIKPLSAVNVVVPALRLTFDLPGVPYVEPCFADSARRYTELNTKEEAPLLHRAESESKWHKGLVGTVYEVSRTDYVKIIATEGSVYHDLLIDCYALDTDESKEVPAEPTGKPFKAHTLFAEEDASRVKRPIPGYAQPSARYLKLITDGAKQRQLPLEYRHYLDSFRSYQITTRGQWFGKVILFTFWFGPLMTVFFLKRVLAGKNGRAPSWFDAITDSMFAAVWRSYDFLLKPLCGDGERTISKGHIV